MADKFDLSLLVVAGFPRTGTTSIYRNLELHPGFAVPVRKELNFFCRDDQPLTSYKAHFVHHRQGQICVDVSPTYCLDPESPERLRAGVPDARVVLLLREPAEWIRSLYTQMCSFTPNAPTFTQFLEKPTLKQFNQQFHFSLGGDGVYRRALSAFSGAFGENLLVIDFAAFEKDPLLILKQIEAFAGTSLYFTPETVDSRAHNSSQLGQRYSPQLRWLLSKERLVQTAATVVPAPLLRRARSMLYYANGAHSSAPKPTPENEHDAAIARAATAADSETYVEIFKTAQVRRGSDLPW